MLVIFTLAFSLMSLQAASSVTPFPTLHLAHATVITPSPQPWNPAGPAMNTEIGAIFTDDQAEFISMSNPSPGIDMMDWPLSTAMTNTLSGSSNSYYVTPPVVTGFSEIEFNLANSFWGCNMSYGNSGCGVEIRQGIGHLIDKQTFATTETLIAGHSIALDNPVLPSDGLLAPNSCGWDTLYPGLNSNCVTSNPNTGSGGIALNCFATAAQCPTGTGSATGMCGTESSPSACYRPWMRGFGSPDFCAAADHFIRAGLAMGKDSNCVLTGQSSSVTARPVNIFYRQDNPDLVDLAVGFSETICALFTGGYTFGCISGSSTNLCSTPRTTSFPTDAILCVTAGLFNYFTGIFTPTNAVNTDWWIYTAGAGVFPSINPFEENQAKEITDLANDPLGTGLYAYNSKFASGGPWDDSYCSSVVAYEAPVNYMYVCNSKFDQWSSAMEYASCLAASGDPVVGSSSNVAQGTCPGSPPGTSCPSTPSSCSASSDGFEAEIVLGNLTLTLPIWAGYASFAYLNNWEGVQSVAESGTSNFFTPLNAYTTTPGIPGSIRQGFSGSTDNLNPYAASSSHDYMILGNIYDSILASNPLNPSQTIDWMTRGHSFVANGALGYTPPAGTTVTLRAVLRNDIFFHDGQTVTAWDVAFSYLSMVANGIAQAGPAIDILAGVTVLSDTNFDLNLRQSGLFTEGLLGNLAIIPGHIWYSTTSGCPSSWSAVTTTSTPAIYGADTSTCLNTSPTMASPTFDPLSAGVLIGSGPWVCENTGANTNVPIGTVGTGCSDDNTSSPTISFTLTRFGCTVGSGGTTCVAPNTTPSLLSQYFRSSANEARWFWSDNTGSPSHDLVTMSTLANCYGKPLGTAGCTHWQQGIGAPGGLAIIGLSQISGVSRFYLLNWTSPIAWVAVNGIAVGASNSLDGIPAPVIYENDPILASGIALNPASVAGCSTTTPYPVSGYDC